ncbi:MAG: HAMP domain-containing histidine kinase [Acidobacteria bacterium]|nr:HAMP domain-containing histidine kinase [Acidobacteriota bacterium]
MRFRRKLLMLLAVSVLLPLAAVTWIVSAIARSAFERASDERSSTLVAQFRHEFTRRGEEVSRRVQAAASAPEVMRMAIAAAQTSPNYSFFLDDARALAEAQRLDFLECADDRGTIISSAQWPAKFGYKEPLVIWPIAASPFLKQEEMPTGPELGLFAVRGLRAGDRKLYLIGGVRLDRTFLSSLDLPTDMRVMLYGSAGRPFSARHLITAGDGLQNAQLLAPLIERVARNGRESSGLIDWGHGAEEIINAFPLTGENNQLLGILLVGSSRRLYNQLRSQIRSAALVAAGAGLLLAVALSSWAAARVTRPIEELARAAHEVAVGNWKTRVAAGRRDEIGDLGKAFNRMTGDLLEQRERLLQAERVAAWRELARRLAHELKNPLFPLQLTVENLLRSRRQGGQQFEDTFHESASTLLSEIANLKTIVARFSEFSAMPQPQFQSVAVDDLLSHVARIYQPQLERAGIRMTLELSAPEPIAADPDLLDRAVSNLVLNAIEAMPQGGTLALRTHQQGAGVSIEISDTGAGLTPAECERLFTPYYTSKPHGTGLGLAIAQSVVSDHAGRIRVHSEPNHGTRFTIELPANRDKLPAAVGTHV